MSPSFYWCCLLVMATRKKDYKKENNLDSKWMTWMTHLAPWDNVKTVHFFTFFATVGNLRSLYWKIKAQKNKQARVVRFIVFAIWEEFLTELEKHLELRVCRATTITVTPSFTWSFFKVVYIAVNCTKFGKNCVVHLFKKITFLKSSFGDEIIKVVSMYRAVFIWVS